MESPIRVCVVNPNYYRSSGVTTVIKRIYEGATDLPICWYFVDCKYGNAIETIDPDFVEKERVLVCDLMTSSIRKLYSAIQLFKKYVKINEIQLVHVHHRRLALILSWALNPVAVPVIYTAHLTYGDNLLFRLNRSAKIIAISDSVLINIKKTLKVVPEKLEKISNPALFETIENNSKSNYIACIGRLEEVKNHEMLIKAWSIVASKYSSYRLKIVGEGSLMSNLKKLAQDMKADESIDFMGYRSDVKHIINDCSFLVLTSFREGHPLVVIEGSALQKATLLTDVDGSRDCVPATFGLPNKIDPLSVNSMAEALDVWLSEPEKVREEGFLFYNYWKSQAAADVVSKKYFEVYTSFV